MLTRELSEYDESEFKHLELEFADYEQLYPKENVDTMIDFRFADEIYQLVSPKPD